MTGHDGLPIEPVEAFLARLQAAGASPRTVAAYAYDLRDYFVWLEQEQVGFEHVGLEHVALFFDWLRRPKPLRTPGVFVLAGTEPAVQASTIVRKRAALATFYRFHSRRDGSIPALLGDLSGPRPTGRFVPMLAHARGGRRRQPSYSPIRIPLQRKRPKTCTDAEVDRLVQACESLRDKLLIRLLDGSGLRIGEALGLRHSDLRLHQGEVHVVPREDNENDARAKGMKGRVVPVGRELLDLYADYMECEYGALDSDHVFINLFRGRLGAPLSASSVQDLAARLRRRTQIEHFHPHTLRHTYATRLLRAKVPGEVVAELLGHRSSQTTNETYSHLKVEDHRRILVEAGLLGGVA